MKNKNKKNVETSTPSNGIKLKIRAERDAKDITEILSL